MAEKKKQHYVPQMYLRYFSRDGRSIITYSKAQNSILSLNASIKGQCVKNYMYGKDPEVENILSNLEREANKVITDIICSSRIPQRDSEEYHTLITFSIIQSGRTQYRSGIFQEMVDHTMKSVLRDTIRLNNLGFTEEDLGKVNIRMENSGLMVLGVTIESIPLIYDLECKLIINNTQRNFITSDDPVIFYNKYAVDNDFYNKSPFSYTGYVSKGLILIFPLSPRYCLIIYDSKIYKVGGRRLKKNVQLNNINDIDEINLLQMINSENHIYALDVEEEYLLNLYQKARDYYICDKATFREMRLRNEPEAKIVLNGINDIKYKMRNSFIKINKKIPKSYLTNMLNNFMRNPYEVKKWERYFEEKYQKKNI